MDKREQAQENIKKAKELLISSGATEIFVKYPDFDYYYNVHHHKKGHVSAHPYAIKKGLCDCQYRVVYPIYPDEHMVRFDKSEL